MRWTCGRWKKIGEPQSAQKCRTESDEVWMVFVVPFVTATLSGGTNAKATKGPPDAFWHILQ
jgi:hypothetical protein